MTREFIVLSKLPQCTLTPPLAVDVVKTRIQIDPTFKGLGILSGTRKVIASEGPAALLTGFGPSAFLCSLI
jgi:hypothetical protein